MSRKTNSKKKKRNNHATIRDQFLEALEAFDPKTPWIKPWATGCGLVNATTNRPYSGINILLLSIRALQLGVEGGGWLTFPQAKSIGASITKGQKSTKVVAYRPFTKTNEETGEEEDRCFMTIHSVFHTSQCSDLDVDKLKLPKPNMETLNQKRVDVEAFIDALALDVRHGRGHAAYNPLTDVISMPNRTDFSNLDHYYSTLFHEMIHATGYFRRLDRTLSTTDRQAYAFEELIAEMGAILLGTRFGIVNNFDQQHAEQHAAYITYWKGLLKADDKALFKAWSQASKAVDWLVERAEGTRIDMVA